ncbi:glucan biosynthesis protein G [Oleiharenicola sp. Vm1]|uniref:glucan biosynthesis protein G n=1 Tax=Oleiharenicola sp. Vm1 TaxID=3398393 RepID=UPI0039F5A3E2
MNFHRLTAACAALLWFTPAGLVAAGVERVTVDHDYVKQLAAEIATEPYEPPREQVSPFFRKLGYDQYRRIRFIPENSLWRAENLPFQVQFFHPGYLFNQTLEIHEFTATHTQPIPFTQKFFDYQELKPSFWAKRGLNYAGFRVINEINQPGKWDEIISFLGASYFRALAKEQRYGISARGLALNAGGPAAEEFPAFIEFWLGKPEAGAKSLTVHALLDSKSVCGAYSFVITPGAETVIDVKATLFFRTGVDLPGFAPLTSMFWYGEASPHHYGDFRPEVHDSDGLLVAPSSGERLWRPLTNPAGLQRSDFTAPALAGFGLLQRDRDFRSYEDLEAFYHQRPSVWVETVGPWPAGKVRLVELPAGNEFNDNIVAFFTPDQPVAPGKPLELAWRLHWTNAATFGGAPGWVRSTRQTIHDGADNRTRYVVDFNGLTTDLVPANAELFPEIVTAGPAKLEHVHVVRNEQDGSWRLVMAFSAAPGAPLTELRARLKLGDKVVTETWAMAWKP